MFEWIWKKPTPPEPRPPHVPIEIRLHTEFKGNLIACAKAFVTNYRNEQFSDLIMLQVLLMEEMSKRLESYPKK